MRLHVFWQYEIVAILAIWDLQVSWQSTSLQVSWQYETSGISTIRDCRYLDNMRLQTSWPYKTAGILAIWDCRYLNNVRFQVSRQYEKRDFNTYLSWQYVLVWFDNLRLHFFPNLKINMRLWFMFLLIWNCYFLILIMSNLGSQSWQC